MSDLIDRQAAIDAIKKRADKARDMVGSDHPFWEGLIVALDIVEQLPSAQPQPEEDCDTCKHGYFGDRQCDNCRVRYPSHYEREEEHHGYD